MAKLSNITVRFTAKDGSYKKFEWEDCGYIFICTCSSDDEYNSVLIFGTLSLFRSIIKAFEKERGFCYTKEIKRTYRDAE